MQNKIEKQLAILNRRSLFGMFKTDEKLEALEEISKFGLPSDAKYIVYHVLSNNEAIAKKATTTIKQLLTKWEVRTPWLSLYGSFAYCYGHGQFDRNNFQKFSHFEAEEAIHLYGIASLNHNGYIREEALSYLQNLATPDTLPYILLRLNDWVPQVQNKAKDALIQLLPKIPITALIKNHKLIEWLEKTKRSDFHLGYVRRKIFSQLNEPENRASLLQAMDEASFRERLFCWKHLAKEITQDGTLIDKAISDPAPEIRRWATHNLPKNDKFQERLRLLLKDDSPGVRYAALKAIPEDIRAQHKCFFDIAIFDDSKRIRNYARFVLRLLGDDNHCSKYQEKLLKLQDANLATPGTILGLAETDTRSAIELIKSFQNHQRSKVRAAVLSALSQLKAEGVDELYLKGLQDSNTKVRKVCVSILQSEHGHLKNELLDLLKYGQLQTQKASLKVLAGCILEESLLAIVLALNEANEELQAMAWHYLVNWHREHAMRLWIRCNNETYDEILELLGALKTKNINPPFYALKVWDDVPRIMETLGR